MEILYKPEEAAHDILKVSRSTVWVLINSGELRSVKVGRARRIPASSLQEFIDKKKEEATQAVPSSAS